MTESAPHAHDWYVFSTTLAPPALLVRCSCGAVGEVGPEHFEPGDWDQAFWARQRPYPLLPRMVDKVRVLTGDDAEARLAREVTGATKEATRTLAEVSAATLPKESDDERR